MADNDKNIPGDGAGNNTSSSTPNGTDPIKTGADAGGSVVDPSKFSAADWERIYADPKLYEHSRFKGLTDAAKRARELEKEKEESEKKKLIEKEEFKTLAEKNAEEAKTWKSKAEQTAVDHNISLEAGKLGVVDVEAVIKLIERKDIKLGDDGVVTGVAEAVKALVESKPYLVNKGGKIAPTIGGGTAPGAEDTTTPRFKISQLRDNSFFKAHEKEINQALKLGLIENDLNLGA